MVTNPTELCGILPDCLPTHGSDKVGGHMARSCLAMGLDGQQVIGDVAWDIGWHGVRRKLEEWRLFLVSQPQQQPTIIGGPMHP